MPHISGIRIWGKDGVPILIGEVQVRCRFSDSNRLVGPLLLFLRQMNGYYDLLYLQHTIILYSCLSTITEMYN